MPSRTPITAVVVENITEFKLRLNRHFASDGQYCPDEQSLLRELRGITQLATSADEARLDAISYLEHGELNMQRRRSHRELAQRQSDDEGPRAA